MPDYLCLIYAEDGDEATVAARWAELPEWNEVANSLRDAGILIHNNALASPDTATTVRVRDGEVQLIDGPFATTKEVLGSYFLLRCENLDEALRAAARFPSARYGSVEVRPIYSER